MRSDQNRLERAIRAYKVSNLNSQITRMGGDIPDCAKKLDTTHPMLWLALSDDPAIPNQFIDALIRKAERFKK